MLTIEKAGAQSTSAPFTFVLSTGDVDRMGDVVVQAGISLAAFKKNPVALFAHNNRQPIGTWENIRRDGDSLIADLKLAALGTSRMIDELRSLIEQKILRATSIGFGVVKSEPLDPERPYGGVRFTKTELLEASLVAVPANPNALALRSLSPELRALLTSEDSGNEPHASAEARALVATKRPDVPGNQKMTLQERIAAARAKLAQTDEEIAALAKSAEEGELTTEQHERIGTLTTERATAAKNLASLESLDKAARERAVPAVLQVSAAGGRANVRTVESKEEKGSLLVRMACAQVMAQQARRPVLDIVKEHFHHDPRVDAVVRSAVGVADTTTAGWAAELVRQDVQGLIEALVPLSVYAAIASRSTVINFGDAGSVVVPSRAAAFGSTDLAGAFVGENGVIPVKRTTMQSATLYRYKMAVISTITKELSRVSTPQAEALIREFMLNDTAVALDKAFLGNAAAVAGTRPAGITNGVAAIPASAAATSFEKALADLKALMNALVAGGAGARPVFVMNPAQRLALSSMYSAGSWMFQSELAGGRLLGAEVVSSMTVPPGDVWLIDAAGIATALGASEFDASDTATLTMANADTTAPTQATLAGDRTAVGTAEEVPPDGGISVMDAAQRAAGKAGEGALSISMFQQWSIALRHVMPISWGKVRPGVVQWVDNVTW